MNCVKLHEEGSLAVSGSVDGTARIWDLRSRSYEPIQERIKYVCDAHSKAGCIFPMAVVSILPHPEFEPSDHLENAPLFIQSLPLKRSSQMHETQSHHAK